MITYRVPYYQSYNILRTALPRTLLIYLAQQSANVHFSCNICLKKRINQRKLLFNVLKYGSQMIKRSDVQILFFTVISICQDINVNLPIVKNHSFLMQFVVVLFHLALSMLRKMTGDFYTLLYIIRYIFKHDILISGLYAISMAKYQNVKMKKNKRLKIIEEIIME